MESPQKAFIESIRRDRFSIGAKTPNPLAGSLHQAIRHLSAELYQKDIHFISELIQNAEDNSYEKGVEPELDLVLTRTDITGVGAAATLILFNNELGFEERNISALCSVGQSTKKGQRNEGYIGEKGIGFKSVFVVTSTPYIISNGFRIRLSDSGEESTGAAAGVGYIVPKWVETPTDDEVRRFWRPAAGSNSEGSLPRTIIILPLRPEKVAAVRAELKQISPETILFLRRITRLRVRDGTGGKVHGEELIISRSDSSRVLHGDTNAVVWTTKLSLLKEPGRITDVCDYFLWEQRFDVTASVEQRKEVKTWVITLAFPQYGRIAGASHGSIFAFLPSQLTSGFPFLINADFLLVSSRETLKFDSPWNQGILACIPTAFCEAVGVLLGKFDVACTISTGPPAQHVYKYVPVWDCHCHLQSVQMRILRDLQRQESILLAANVHSRIIKDTQALCIPFRSRRVDQRFRRILEKAFEEQNVSAVIASSKWFVVHGTVQSKYSAALDKLEVPWMSRAEYLQILSDWNWLLKLSDDLYLEILAFVSALSSVPVSAQDSINPTQLTSCIHSLRIVKYEDSQGIKFISINEITDSKMAMYVWPPEEGSHLSKWIESFNPWIAFRFMPLETVNVMDKAKYGHVGVEWLKTTASVRKVDVDIFVGELVERCTKDPHSKSQPPLIDANFVLLVWKFVYTSIQEGRLKAFALKKYHDFAVVDDSSNVRWIKAQGTKPLVLLPRSCSKWPLLLTDKTWATHSQAIIRMTDEYLNVNEESSQPGENEQEACRVFLQKTFGACDLPDLPLPDLPFPQLTGLSSEQSRLLFQWLNRFWESNEETIDTLLNQNKLWLSLKKTAWLHTEMHGLQRPKVCFIRNDKLKQVFQQSEVPFIDFSFYGDQNLYPEILQKLGVVQCLEAGYGALVKQVQVLMSEPSSVSKETMVKFYRLLQVYQWKPKPKDLGRNYIFVPAGTGRPASWEGAELCLIEDPENLFRVVLPILREIYPENLLPFFEEVLGVSRIAPYPKYYDLWITWGENLKHYDPKKCAQLWAKIAVNWKLCTPDEKQNFKAKAAVLTAVECGKLQSTSPELAFIPDDLQLRSIFMSSRTKHLFVWYPEDSSTFEAELTEVYAFLGVKRLSACVEMTSYTNINTLSKCSTSPTPRFLTLGLLVAILGFISNAEYAFSSERRQIIISALCKSVEEELSDPCRMRYKLSRSVGGRRHLWSCVTVERHLFGFWDGKGVIYGLGDTHKLLSEAVNVRQLETQVLESICTKILSDYPTIAKNLVDFLKLLVGCRFDEATVEYELRRKNLKLYSGDLDFLKKFKNPIMDTVVKPGVFRTLL